MDSPRGTVLPDWVLALIGEAGLVNPVCERIGVDASTMEASTSAILPQLSCGATRVKSYREMLEHLARDLKRHFETPTAEEALAALLGSSQAQGLSKLSNEDWVSKERPRGQDRQRWQDGTTSSGLQARRLFLRWIWHLFRRPHGGRRSSAPWPIVGRHDDASQNVGDGQGEPDRER